MKLTAAKVGQKFRIPDWHGGYARCCGPEGSVAIFELVRCEGDMFGEGQKCLACGKVVANDATFVRDIEPIHETGDL